MTQAAVRGILLQSPPALMNTYAPADILTLLGGNALGLELLQLAYSPVCAVTV